MPKTQPPPPPEQSRAPEIVSKPSPESVLLFLKHAALEKEWTLAHAVEALGIDQTMARKIADELGLVGYIETVPRKRDTWRNTSAGNTVAGVRPPRLTRKTAEELVAGMADRAAAFNKESERPLHADKIVAFGGINTKHDRIQDIDIGIRLKPKLGREATQADIDAALKALRGRSPALKTHLLERWPPRMGRTVWQS